MAGISHSRLRTFTIGFVFSGAMACFALKHFLHYSPQWVNILNDVLAIPVILSGMNAIMQFLYGSCFRLPFLICLFSTIIITLLFEVIFPLVSESSTSDVWDVVWYFFGLNFYWFFLRTKNRSLAESNSNSY